MFATFWGLLFRRQPSYLSDPMQMQCQQQDFTPDIAAQNAPNALVLAAQAMPLALPRPRMMHDCLGREIKVGDRIVYVTRRGSWMDMRPATVLEVTPDSVLVAREHSFDKPTATLRTERYIAVVA